MQDGHLIEKRFAADAQKLRRFCSVAAGIPQGLNKEVIDDLKRHSPPRDEVTPETLSASYARISRDPRPVDELRAAALAEVERARRSNQSSIFYTTGERMNARCRTMKLTCASAPPAGLRSPVPGRFPFSGSSVNAG